MLWVTEENNQLTHEVLVVVTGAAAAVTANHDHVLECEIATQVAEGVSRIHSTW